jgi:hypothetical protein
MIRRFDSWLVMFSAVLVLGCAASPATPAMDAANNSDGKTTDGTTSDGSGTDNAAVSDTGTTCPHPPDLTAAAPACNSVVNSAHAVPFTARTGTPPTPMGGMILDGVYVSTATEGWGAVSPAGRRITIVVLGGATQMLWTGEVLDATGATVTLSFAANAHAAASGKQIAFTVDCSSSSPSPIPPALTYTATATQLILSLTNGADSSVTTYTRTGCP